METHSFAPSSTLLKFLIQTGTRAKVWWQTFCVCVESQLLGG